jgi:recombination protein RecT
VIRRLFKYLPVSIELAQAVALDEQAEDGRQQDNPLTIDVEHTEVPQEQADDQAEDLALPHLLELLDGATDVEAIDYVRSLGNRLPETERAQLAQASRKRLQAIEAPAAEAQA